MPLYTINGDTLTSIADAIREKTGIGDKIAPANFPAEIRSIVTAGGSGGGNMLYSRGNLSFYGNPTSEKQVIEHGLGVMPDLIIVQCFIGAASSYDDPTCCFASGFNSKFTGITGWKSNWGFYTNRVANPDAPMIGFSIMGIDRGMDELTEADRANGYIYTPDSRTFEIGCYDGAKFNGNYNWNAYAWLSD